MQTKSPQADHVFVVRDAVLTYLHTRYPDQNIVRHPLFKAVREWFMEQMEDRRPLPPAA